MSRVSVEARTDSVPPTVPPAPTAGVIAGRPTEADIESMRRASYGTVDDQAVVSPDSKPSANGISGQRVKIAKPAS